ncbi:NAD(P)-dependent oxidoreductase [Streptomyces guryensis]|uniref:NAD(P)-binding domain-containing protein n=1 Tax=Streptomyces guryensis TaxID=2886947 RepID=A0A9Q3VKN9_9ACTN|nr:NAD(P)-binding domain-containing protein [Streptomyces guryensis]MCD9872620.1 NAD(P)-binding domain-containing protein [Streptomyces guryensis]
MPQMDQTAQMDRIAFLGLGHMGAPMARRLLAAGHPLTVWNRTAAKAAPLVAEGAVLAAPPAHAVREADVVITTVADPAALDAVAGEIVPALRPGTHWIEMPTVGPDAVRELAARAGESATVIDAPVKDLALATKAAELPAMEAALDHYRRTAADPALADADLSHEAAGIRTS